MKEVHSVGFHLYKAGDVLTNLEGQNQITGYRGGGRQQEGYHKEAQGRFGVIGAFTTLAVLTVSQVLYTYIEIYQILHFKYVQFISKKNVISKKKAVYKEQDAEVLNMAYPGEPRMPTPSSVCPGGRAGSVSSLCLLSRGSVGGTPTPLVNFCPPQHKMAVSTVSPISHDLSQGIWMQQATARPHEVLLHKPDIKQRTMKWVSTLEKGKPISIPLPQGLKQAGCLLGRIEKEPLLEGAASYVCKQPLCVEKKGASYTRHIAWGDAGKASKEVFEVSLRVTFRSREAILPGAVTLPGPS